MATGAATIESGIEVANKDGSKPFTFAITDAGNSDAAVTPDSATWSLYDAAGVLVGTADRAITPAESMTIVPTSSDNTISNNLRERAILLKAVIDLAVGNNKDYRRLITYHIAETPE